MTQALGVEQKGGGEGSDDEVHAKQFGQPCKPQGCQNERGKLRGGNPQARDQIGDPRRPEIAGGSDNEEEQRGFAKQRQHRPNPRDGTCRNCAGQDREEHKSDDIVENCSGDHRATGWGVDHAEIHEHADGDRDRRN